MIEKFVTCRFFCVCQSFCRNVKLLLFKKKRCSRWEQLKKNTWNYTIETRWVFDNWMKGVNPFAQRLRRWQHSSSGSKPLLNDKKKVLAAAAAAVTTSTTSDTLMINKVRETCDWRAFLSAQAKRYDMMAHIYNNKINLFGIQLQKRQFTAALTKFIRNEITFGIIDAFTTTSSREKKNRTHSHPCTLPIQSGQGEGTTVWE